MASLPSATDPILCHCLQVRESEVRDAVAAGRVCCLRDVVEQTEAGSGCTACHRAIQAVLAGRESRPAESPAGRPTTPAHSPLPAPICMAK